MGGQRRYVATPDSSSSANVGRVYAQTAAWNLSVTLWQNQLLSLYLFAVFDGDMRSVGLAEGAQGIARLLSAVVIGRAVDRLPRRALLAMASTSGVALHMVVAYLIGWPPPLDADGRLLLWLLMLGVFAVWTSLQQTLADVLFADSIPTGGYMARGAVVRAAQMTGPLVQLTAFAATGAATWSSETIRPPMLCGVLTGAFASALLGRLDPSATLGDVSEAHHVQAAQPASSAELEGARSSSVELEGDPPPLDVQGAQRAAAAEAALNGAEAEAVGGTMAWAGVRGRKEARVPELASCDATHPDGGALAPGATAWASADGEGGVLDARAARRLRWTIVVFDLLRVCAGGLVVKFWGLYFVDRFALTPYALSLLMAAVFALGLVTVLAVGRAVAACHLRRGATCLALLGIVNACNFGTALSPHVALAATSWACREAALGGMLELKKSLMMDHTPKASRGAWNAVQALQQGMWSGTATIGGYVIAAHGFEADFLLMSAFFLVSAAVWATIARVR